jgi:hypothetical protein
MSPILTTGSKTEQAALQKAIKAALSKEPDPTVLVRNGNAPPSLRVSEVVRVYESDKRGLREVLFLGLNSEGERIPRTAWVIGAAPYVLAYVEEGW